MCMWDFSVEKNTFDKMVGLLQQLHLVSYSKEGKLYEINSS